MDRSPKADVLQKCKWELYHRFRKKTEVARISFPNVNKSNSIIESHSKFINNAKKLNENNKEEDKDYIKMNTIKTERIKNKGKLTRANDNSPTNSDSSRDSRTVN